MWGCCSLTVDTLSRLALVTDASDDDPSGIGTYPQVGAQGVGLLNQAWQLETTLLFSLATSLYVWAAPIAIKAALGM